MKNYLHNLNLLPLTSVHLVKKNKLVAIRGTIIKD